MASNEDMVEVGLQLNELSVKAIVSYTHELKYRSLIGFSL